MRAALAAVAAALALFVPDALAHVEVKPKRATAGAQARLTFEVPNERSAAATTQIAIQLPPGVAVDPSRRSRGWQVVASGRRVTLVAPRGRELRGAERGAFPLELRLPLRPRTSLVFKVIQTYDNGEVVRWIGPPGTSEPGARLRLAAPKPERPPQGATGERPPKVQTNAPSQPAEDDGGDGGGPPIWAGIGLMLLAAVAGTAAARARNRRRMRDYTDK